MRQEKRTLFVKREVFGMTFGWPRSQVARQGSAKPLYVGAIPTAASN
jgi:hypothetical protein